MHQQMQSGQIEKRYFALVNGSWQDRKRVIDLPLVKRVTASGERRVNVGAQGDRAITVVRLERYVGPYSLLDAELKTGRTHQIRIHLSSVGHPVIGDDTYGGGGGRKLAALPPRRHFLHAAWLRFKHPVSGEVIDLRSPLPDDLRQSLATLSDMPELATHQDPLDVFGFYRTDELSGARGAGSE
jgi:23S rRNA-/tRNA-specific pseudouridylate synthase